jgi:protein-tyrosine-phosphatase
VRVLTVCTGNTCRSPLAAAVMSRLRPDWSVASAGLAAREGEPATHLARTVAQERGLDLSAHRSRALTAAAVNGADVILTMTQDHREALVSRFPQAAPRTLTLGEAAGDPRAEVTDPYGRDETAYRETLDQLAEMCQRAAEHLDRPAPLGRVAALDFDAKGSRLAQAVAGALRREGFRVEPEALATEEVGSHVARRLASGRVGFGVAVTEAGMDAVWRLAQASPAVKPLLGTAAPWVRWWRRTLGGNALCLASGLVAADAVEETLWVFVRTAEQAEVADQAPGGEGA